MTILITGCSGFIGSHLIQKLNEDIVGIDIRELEKKFKIPFYKCDIRNYRKLDKIFKKEGIDKIIHLAALINVEESMEKPLKYHEVNVKGTLNLLLLSIKYRIKKFIYAGTAAVYGDPVYLPIDEKHPINPKSIYGITKASAEACLISYVNSFGLSGISLRIFNTYGPGQKPNQYAGVITKFLERAKNGLPPIIYGSGKQTRDFIFIDDVINAFKKAVEKDVSGIFNIGYGKPVSINYLAKLFVKKFCLNNPIYEKLREADILHSYAKITKAKKILHWRPAIDIKKGLNVLFKTNDKA
jgi:UDP-glucose 4-epimerase